MGPLTLLIKPVSSSCNMRCKYCFYFDQADHREIDNYGVMSDSTLKAIVKKSFDYSTGEVSFAFQGGEPTIAGIDYYKRFLLLVDKYNTKGLRVNLSIQTNGLNLNNDWAEFLSKNRFLVGLSLDGDRNIHNANRVDFRGNGTYNKVIKASELLREYNIDFNILSVVTKVLARSAEKVYQSFKDRDFRYIQFIPCIGDIHGEVRDYSLGYEDYGNFLVKVYDLWERDIYNRRFVSIRYFDNLLLILANYQPEACSMRGACSPNLLVESDGSLFPCDFYALDKWNIGNINSLSIEDAFTSSVLKSFISSSTEIGDECNSCKYLRICRGGCRRYKSQKNSDYPGENYYCKSFKYFFRNRLNSLVELYKYVRENPLTEV